MDTYDFLADPRALSLAERCAARDANRGEQERWLDRLRQLVDGPKPDADFPAFLLATPPFAELARRLAAAPRRQDLPPAVADELDWFVRVFADYLRTQDGEDAFETTPRLTG